MKSELKVKSPQALIKSCQGLVRSIAWKLHQKLPASVDLEDLVGFGQVGLAEAARDFDQKRGVQFTTYAWYRVRGAILDGLSKMNWFDRADYAGGRYARTSNDILSTAGASTESSDSSWFARTTRAMSMSYVMANWVAEDVEPVDANAPAPSDVAEQSELQQVVRKLLTDLPEQERKLIQGIYFDGMTIKEAGEQIGISKAWASRLHARVLDTLALQLCVDHDN